MTSISWFEYPTQLVWWQLALYYASVAWGAFVIGCFGVGGGAVFMPLMLFLPGVTPSIAAGAIYCGTVPMSTVMNLQLCRYGVSNIGRALPLMLGALAGSLSGQAALPYLPAEGVAFFIAALTIMAGIQTHLKVAGERHVKAADAKKAAEVEAAVAALAADPSCGAVGEAVAEPEAPVAEPEAVAAAQSADKGGTADGLGAGPLNVTGGELAPEGVTPGVHPDIEAGDGPPVPQPTAKRTTSGKSMLSLDSVPTTASERVLKNLAFICLGAVVSFLSSISGTGGPLLLFPIWMYLDPGVSTRLLVATTAPFSLTLACASAVGALLFGHVDLGFAVVFAVCASTGVALGVRTMVRLGDSRLKVAVAGILVIIGVFLAVQTAFQLAS